MNEEISESVLRFFGHIERLENSKVTKDNTRGIGFNVNKKGWTWGNNERMVHVIKEWGRGVCEEEWLGLSGGSEPLTLTRCHRHRLTH